MEVNVKYRKDEGTFFDDSTIYRRLVGSLIYLTTTRPDISYVVHKVSQFMASPRHLHLAAVQCIISYLRGSLARGLFFPTGSALHLVAYSDADWAGCPDTRRSTIGWCMVLGDALISWKCKKQDRVSKSSIEAEYCAMSTIMLGVKWIDDLCQATALLGTAIFIASNLVFHERNKHIEVDCHFIRDVIMDGSNSIGEIIRPIWRHMLKSRLQFRLCANINCLVLFEWCRDGRIKVVGGKNIEGLLVSPKQLPFKN
ncbi:secreted RxLR effector protein 161-like [Aristolochia californica]|uniref:secreted RxLR effector protein 161-like n=1 Tax=Aristolochia californica TaxID=171875 RepID=UPI0035DCFF21